MSSYARLAQLPRPRLAPVDVGRVGAARGERSRRGCAVHVAEGPPLTHCRRRGSTRSAADQSGAERRRRGDSRPAAGCSGVDDGGRPFRRRRWSMTGPGLCRHGQPLRPVLHHQAQRLGHRPGAEPPNRRGPRRDARPWPIASGRAAASRRCACHRLHPYLAPPPEPYSCLLPAPRPHPSPLTSRPSPLCPSQPPARLLVSHPTSSAVSIFYSLLSTLYVWPSRVR